jgi:META domain
MKRLKQIAILAMSCLTGAVSLIALTPSTVRSAEVDRAAVLQSFVGTTWMYGGLWTFSRPNPSDPATVRLRFPAEGKVQIEGPCGSEVGELGSLNGGALSGAPWQFVGTFSSAVAPQCPGSPRQGIVGDLIRSGIDGSNNGLQAMFRSNGHTFFEDTTTGLAPLAGTGWDVESVDGQALAPLHWNVEFRANGMLEGSDECNGFNGLYVTKDSLLRTTAVTSTAMGCSSHSPLPRPFGSSPKTRFFLTNDQLVITEEGGHTFVLRPKSFGLPFAGTRWKTLVGKEKATLQFLPESRVQLSTPCFSAEIPYKLQRIYSQSYQASFDFSTVSNRPDRGKCRVGFGVLSSLQAVTMSSQDSLVLRLGDGPLSAPESFQSRLTFEIDTPVDPNKTLAGSRWRLDSYTLNTANSIEFRTDGTLRYQNQCGIWIYRVNEQSKLEIQQKSGCTRRLWLPPFDLPVLRLALSPSGKTLELFNIANRSIAQYKRLR